ncbi:MAG: CHASE3 domain-containing protein [Parachlamydia sp.]|jgi:CHASE3 domain sensor protein/signal transduction histidine kinase|nr:CHASE3 domain-containing protein [Parachlamydia sp.]
MRKKYIAGILLGILSVLAISTFAYFAFKDLLKGYETRRIIFTQQYYLLQLLSSLKDAELGQRGYLIAKRDDYLEPYYTALKSLDNYMLKVRDAASSYNQTPLFNEFERLVKIKLNLMSQDIMQIKLGKKDLEGQALNQDAGKRIMDNIRSIAAQLISTADLKLSQVQQEIDTRARQTVWGILFSIFFINFLIGLYSYLFYRDTKRLDKMTKALDYTSHVYQAVFENAEQGIIRTDDRGSIQGMNKKAGMLLNCPLDEAIDKSILNFYDQGSLKHKLTGFGQVDSISFNAFLNLIKAFLSGNGEYLLRAKDGSIIPCSQTVSVLKNNEGEVTGYLFLLMDQTEAKQWKKNLNNAKEAVEAAYLSRNKFIASLGHDFKPPLTSIVKNASLLSKIPAYELREQNAISEIGSQARRLLDLTNRIVDFNKNSAHLQAVNGNETVNLSDFMRKIIKEFEFNWKMSDGEIKVQAEVPFEIKSFNTHYDKFKDILLNLLQAAALQPNTGLLMIRVKCHPDSFLPKAITIGSYSDHDGEMNGNELPLEEIKGASRLSISLADSLANILGYQVKVYGTKSRVILSLNI